MLNFRNVSGICILLLVSFFALTLLGTSIPIIVFMAIVFTWLTLTIYGAFNIRAGYFIKSYCGNRNHPNKEVALTFDDGPHPDYTPQILNVLRRHNAKATFFLIGSKVDKHPEIVRQIHADGHLIGNHTYSHSNSLGFFSTARMHHELEQATTSIDQVAGVRPRLFRPAFGVTNPNIAKTVNSLGMQSIGWSIRSFDTFPWSSKRIVSWISSRMRPGDTLLLHDDRPGTPEIMEHFLLILRESGYKTVRIDELHKLQAYE